MSKRTRSTGQAIATLSTEQATALAAALAATHSRRPHLTAWAAAVKTAMDRDDDGGWDGDDGR